MGYFIFDIEAVPENEFFMEVEAKETNGLPPLYTFKPVVIGYTLLDFNYNVKRAGIIEAETEKGLLEQFSLFVSNGWYPYVAGVDPHTIVTWNGRRFDLPVIALRHLRHGLSMAWYYEIRSVRHRYSPEGHLDLCDYLSDFGAGEMVSLHVASKLIGLPGKMKITGEKVRDLYSAGRLSEIQDYCMLDVVETTFLFLRIHLMRGVLKLERYREACLAIFEKLEQRPERYAEFLALTDRKILLLDS